MFSNSSSYKYNITLPSSTSTEVVEWFEIAENSNKLSESLIELVYENMRSRKPVKTAQSHTNTCDEKAAPQDGQVTSQDGFFDNLYNWQDSNNAVFSDAKEEKKEKKRMLTV